MIRDEHLLAALDALRSRDELALPQFADLARHVEQHPEDAALVDRALAFDRRVASALEEVPVPTGLREQLLARLALAGDHAPVVGWSRPLAAALDQAVTDGQTAPAATIASPAVEEGAPADPSRAARGADGPWSRLRLSRRRVLVLTGIAATAATVAWMCRPIGEFDRDGIALEANSAFHELADAGAAARPLGDADRIGNFPFSQQIARFGDVRWRSLEQFLGRHGVAFELRSPAGVRGTLFVVKLLGGARAPVISAASIPHRPTLHNAGSGGLTTAIWQEQGHLFVLVVDADERAYRHFLPPVATVT